MKTIILCCLVVSFFGCASMKYTSKKKEKEEKGAVQAAAPEPTRQNSFQCESTREYITTIEYLRDQKDLAVSESEARKIAGEVAKGCNDAANRFIKVSGLLTKSHLSGRDSVDSALKFTQKTNKEMKAFLEVFQSAYLEDELDMDLATSVSMAHSLSNEFDGDSDIARSDFKQVVKFCINQEAISNKKADCGKLAAKVAKQGQISKESVASAFIAGFEYLRSEDGPAMKPDEAVKMATWLVGVSPKAVTNYIDAFDYGTSKVGLALGSKEAAAFAKNMAEYTGPEAVSAVKKE